jgi:hypothetical protein
MVNKVCFKKSVVHDFVWILLIIVTLVIIGILYLIGNALIPILTPFGTAYNWAVALSILSMLTLLVVPLVSSPYEMKQFPTAVLLVIYYMLDVMIFIFYNASGFHYFNGYIVGRVDMPDIVLFILGTAIVFTIMCPISMGYARCRGE